MEIEYKDNSIILDKELNKLDKFVISFTKILNELSINYVIVSGYVAILFGRSRDSEDIDMIVSKLDKEKFSELWNALSIEFECINVSDKDKAYSEYLLTNHAIRFSKKDKFVPNVEIKFPKIKLDIKTLEDKKEVILNKNKFFIPPIELQIAFKLFLGSDKDMEDAKYLYNIFKDKLDKKLFQEFNQNLKIREEVIKKIQ